MLNGDTGTVQVKQRSRSGGTSTEYRMQGLGNALTSVQSRDALAMHYNSLHLHFADQRGRGLGMTGPPHFGDSELAGIFAHG